MRSLKLTNDGDLDVTGNSFSLIEDEDNTEQRIKLRLSVKKGEWFRNTNVGLDHSNILGKVFDATKARIDVIEALRQEPEVLDIEFLEVTSDVKQRTASINFIMTTTEGTIEGTVVL